MEGVILFTLSGGTISNYHYSPTSTLNYKYKCRREVNNAKTGVRTTGEFISEETNRI